MRWTRPSDAVLTSFCAEHSTTLYGISQFIQSSRPFENAVQNKTPERSETILLITTSSGAINADGDVKKKTGGIAADEGHRES